MNNIKYICFGLWGAVNFWGVLEFQGGAEEVLGDAQPPAPPSRSTPGYYENLKKCYNGGKG